MYKYQQQITDPKEGSKDMRTYGRKVAALMVGLTLLVFLSPPPMGTFLGFELPAFAPFHNPPSCEITSVTIQGPAQGAVEESLAYKGAAEMQACSGTPKYNWTLGSAPPGAEPWSATGQQVSFTPKVAGDYKLKLEVTAGSGAMQATASAEHKLAAMASSSQPQPPGGAPPPPPTPPPSPAGAFAGTWQGPDTGASYGSGQPRGDNSIITLTLTQTGNQLQATYNDNFDARLDGTRIEPGFHGNCAGQVKSDTEAQINCALSRSDGIRENLIMSLELSNQNNTLTMQAISGNYSGIAFPLTAGPYVLQRLQAAGQTTTDVREESLFYKAQDGGKLLPETLHISTGKLRLFFMGLGAGLETVSIRDAQTQQAIFGVPSFSIQSGQLTVVEFALEKAGDYEIFGGQKVLGKLTTQAPAEVDEHTLIYDKEQTKTLPNVLMVRKGKLRLFNVARGGAFSGVAIRSAASKEALFGAGSFPAGTDAETVLELNIEQAGDYEIVQGDTVLGKLIVK